MTETQNLLHMRALGALLAFALLALALASAPARAAEPPLLRSFCPTGSAGGQCSIPRGIAVDETNGDIYVADSFNERIEKFTAWGEFLRAWGWDVVASGPGDDTTAPEDQFEICVPANGDVCQAGAAIPFETDGGGAGQLDSPKGLAVDSAGDVYVVDRSNLRVQKFSPQGQFLLAFGGDVVAHGPADSANDEVQEITIAAPGGTFKLGFTDPYTRASTDQTGPLPYNATAAEVQAALNGLPTIADNGGSVTVSGGPGDATGTSPYTVTFEGNLGGDNVPQLTIDRSGLAAPPIGARLVCSTPIEAESLSYLWLRNGSPITGAESPTYSTTVADEGKAIQCQIAAKDAYGGAVQTSTPVYVAPPAPAIAPPVAPEVPNPTGYPVVGKSGSLSCNTGVWQGAESFAYRWYRNGTVIPGATSSTYLATAQDLATPAAFQCAVIGSNASGNVTVKLSRTLLTSPPPAVRSWELLIAPFGLPRLNPVRTLTQGGAAEICGAAETCKTGAHGVGAGQFGGYDPFGGEWAVGNFISIDTKGTAAAADDIVYVGDVNRIQKFDASGAYQGQLSLPEPGIVGALAVDRTSGDLYFSYRLEFVENQAAQPAVHRLDPDTGAELDTLAVPTPTAIATDADGNVYAFQEHNNPNNTPHYDSEFLEFDPTGKLINSFADPDFSGAIFTSPPGGIATSSACGIEGTDLLISRPDFEDSFVKLFGPPPNANIPGCEPPEKPPLIEVQFASSVGSDGATVRAKINPRFWPDTTYYVQYGTAACLQAEDWEASCVKEQPAAPGIALTEATIGSALDSKGVFLGASEPLLPDTTYRYRFVAQSSGGGPVRGVGGTEAEDGAEGAFRTYPLSPTPKVDCTNQQFRSGPSAHLPDCRAYELVSPVDKNGGDVLAPGSDVLSQAAADGAALTFVSTTAFADPLGAPLFNQYLAQRQAGGWSPRSINAPRSTVGLVNEENISTRFKAFDESLCSGWLLQDTDLTLVAGAPQHVAGLYRDRALREGCSGPSGYELLSTVFPPGYDPALDKTSSLYYPQIQGFSADGQTALFRAGAALSANACKVPTKAGPEGKRIFQVYLTREGTPGVPPVLVSVLPDGEAACTHSSVGTSQSFGGLFVTPEDSLHNAVSGDAARIYWTATDSVAFSVSAAQAGYQPGKLYLRLNPTKSPSQISGGKCTQPTRACTLAVSKEAEAASGTTASRFLDAAADGSRAVFSTGEDLYEYDLAKALAVETATTLIAGEVKGIMGTSEDASRVYLVSEEELEGEGQAGEPNLYLYERGLGFDFIATLGGSGDASAGDGPNAAPSPIGQYPGKRSSRVSPDGLSAAFVSADPALAQSAAAYDNTDLKSGKPDREVYLYDATANNGEGELICASCNPSGARPAGRVLDLGLPTAARLPAWITAVHPGNALSPDGDRLFFESFEPLVLRDTNGVGDVYQWQRAADKAQCLDQQGGELYLPGSGGCLSLISSGTGAADSLLIDASATGDDVFIRTDTGLLPQDPGLADAYDARALGGFPEPTETAQCEGEACQSPPAPPDDPSPASSAYQGAGNVSAPKPASCRKPKVRRKGRCVAKHKRHARPHRRTPR